MKDETVRLGLIGVAGIIGLSASLALANGARFEPIQLRSLASVLSDESAWADRLHGTVLTMDGEEYTGFIRWDKNEASWADLLDANKELGRGAFADLSSHPKKSDGIRIGGMRLSFGHTLGSSVQSAIRFGHVARIEVLDDDAALVTTKSGLEFEFEGNATDLGNNLRAFVIEDAERGTIELAWRDLDVIEFSPSSNARDAAPEARRLFGTLTTRSGDTFTGYVGWDVDEVYTTDVLDGEQDGFDMEIPFGDIARIERYSSRAALVALHDGEELVLGGTNDVDSSNNGIEISDAGLGEVSVRWDDFESLDFHEPTDQASYGEFDGGRRIEGTVVDEDGREYSGEIRWDNDEAYTWEMLNGRYQGVEYNVEFGEVAEIRKASSQSVQVELLDGRVLRLRDSNDVDGGNRGIFVTSPDGDITLIEWHEFDMLRLNAP